MPLLQAARMLAISTALGPDVLAVRSVAVQEQLGRLSQIEVELTSEDGGIDFDKVITQNATIRLDVGEKGKRYFNGIVSRMVQVANAGGYAHYRATIVPWLWLLTRTADCRIFQQQTVPDILEAVFKGHGLNDYQLKLSNTYEQWEYCVQYRETDFNFVSRLMEEEGIYYYFEHEDGKHTLIIADGTSAHKAFDGYEEVVFHELAEGASEREVITDWVMEKEAQPVAYALNDFDFKKPKTSLRSSASVTRDYSLSEFEIYDYPGAYNDHAEGDRLADVRLNELQSQYEVAHGQASARGLATGCTFKLKNHPRSDQNREYLITGTSLRMEAGEFSSEPAPGGEFFSCHFATIPTKQPFRPARLTPKSVIQGPQTALVVGPAGEEIHTDEFGRVKVQFHWDRYGKADENSSCWVRVSQVWAGKGWGAIYTPRIGQEVIVDFLEGDPDCPIITGRVYNGEAMPPYSLPDQKTKSTLKSNTSKGGAGFNEIRLEDKKGSEQIFIHGERNLDLRIKHDAFETICGERHLVVSKASLEKVGSDRNEIVGADHLESIGKDRHLKVAGMEAKEIGKSLSLYVGADVAEAFAANHSEETSGNYFLHASNIVIQAGTNVTIKVGGSSIVIEDGGIKLSTGGTLELEAKGAASFKSKAQIEMQAPQTSVTGDNVLILKSAEVDITGDTKVEVKGGKIDLNA